MTIRTRARRLQTALRSVQELACDCDCLADFIPRKGTALLARDPMTGQERLVLGAGSVSYASHAQVENLACVVVVLNRDDPQREKLAQLDSERVKDLDWMARTSQTLRQLPLALQDVSALLGLSGRPDAQRVCRLGQRPAALLAAAKTAKVTCGHLRYLTPLNDAEFGRWVLKVGQQKGLSVLGLKEAMMKEETEASGEYGSYETRLSEVLGAEVKIAWPRKAAARNVKVSWYSTEELIGVLRKLASAGELGAKNVKSKKSRPLTLQLQTLDELDAVFGKLGAEQ